MKEAFFIGNMCVWRPEAHGTAAREASERQTIYIYIYIYIRGGLRREQPGAARTKGPSYRESNAEVNNSLKLLTTTTTVQQQQLVLTTTNYYYYYYSTTTTTTNYYY